MRYYSENLFTITEATKYIGKLVRVTFLTDSGPKTCEGIFSSVFLTECGGIYSVNGNRFCNEDVIIVNIL